MRRMRHRLPLGAGRDVRTRSSLIVAVTLVLLCAASAAAAADRVKVVTKTAAIHAAPSAASKTVAVVAAGTVLDVTGRENGWYKVSVPVGLNRAARPGYIEERVVMRTTERAVLVTPGPGGVAVTTPARSGGFHIRGFGEAAFQVFTASESFKAIFGSANGLFYGGGVDVGLGSGLFVTAGVTHFQQAGERAFAYNGQSYPLGIEDRVSITPIVATVGYRFARPRQRFIPYVGAGGGAVLYRETSDFAASGENVSKTAGTFQVLGGVEIPLSRQVALAVEGQYQSVRGILGTTGVSQAFGEKDLGGASVRVKLLFGK